MGLIGALTSRMSPHLEVPGQGWLLRTVGRCRSDSVAVRHQPTSPLSVCTCDLSCPANSHLKVSTPQPLALKPLLILWRSQKPLENPLKGPNVGSQPACL